MTDKANSFSRKTILRWWLAGGLTVIGLAVLASSFYFLFFQQVTWVAEIHSMI